MTNSEYNSLTHLNEIEEKIRKFELEHNDLTDRRNDCLLEAETQEQKILEVRPELAKEIEKAKKHPNKAYNKLNKFCSEAGDFHILCFKYLQNINFIGAVFPEESDRINSKLQSLNREKTEIEINIQSHFQLRNNLPKEFKDALEIVHQHIFTLFKNQQQKNIELYTEQQSFPVCNAMLTAAKGDDAFYYYKLLKSKNGKLKPGMTDLEVLSAFKAAGIEGYYNRPIDEIIEKQSEYFVNKCKKNIQVEQNRNIQKEADNYFHREECRFIDEIVQYCSKVNSVSNVRIGIDGSINGIIHAANGDFNIRTIGAGGYNIQCFHYRVIITKIADNNR